MPGIIGTVPLGMVSGRAIRNRVSLEIFRRWVLIGLICLGVVMVAQAVAGVFMSSRWGDLCEDFAFTGMTLKAARRINLFI